MTTAYTIRPGTAADIDTLVVFTHAEAMDAERRGLDPGEARRGVEGAFAAVPKSRYWVVEGPKGGLVASASIVTEWSNFRGGDYWWIQSLYVTPEHRGQGLVDTLLAHLTDQARNCRGAGSAALRPRHQRAGLARLQALRLHRRSLHRDDPASGPAVTTGGAADYDDSAGVNAFSMSSSAGGRRTLPAANASAWG